MRSVPGVSNTAVAFSAMKSKPKSGSPSNRGPCSYIDAALAIVIPINTHTSHQHAILMSTRECINSTFIKEYAT
jgi:hypothetical protein